MAYGLSSIIARGTGCARAGAVEDTVLEPHFLPRESVHVAQHFAALQAILLSELFRVRTRQAENEYEAC